MELHISCRCANFFHLYSLLLLWTLLNHCSSSGYTPYGTSLLMYEWTSLEFDWPSLDVKDEFVKNKSYVPETNLVAGIKLYKGEVYLTIPRWRWNTGQPATLVKVVSVNGQHRLRPYPDWASQRVGDCNALQYVQSMEIDPNTGRMYVIDTGRTGLASATQQPKNICSAKILVYDLNTNKLLDSYEFPESVVSRTNNFLNDLVLDYVDNEVRYAYITDASEAKLCVFDFKTRSSYSLDHWSMKPEGNGGTVIRINSKNYTFSAGIDGIAMSSDFKYVYYCPLSGYALYQIPTAELRGKKSNTNARRTDMGIRSVGIKISQTDGLAHGSERLYFGALMWNAVYQWEFKKDMATQQKPLNQVRMIHQSKVTRHDQAMQWVDTFAFDEDGWLWFVSNRLHLFANNQMDFSGSDGANVRVWKVYVNDTSYLKDADKRTGIPNTTTIG